MLKSVKSNLYQIALLCYMFILLISIEGIASINLAILRYAVSLFIFYKIVLEVKNNSNKNILNKNWLLIYFIWVVLIVLRNISDVFKDYDNFVNLKRFLSEELILYSFPLLIFINIDLNEIKKILKLNLIFSLVYLILSIVFYQYLINLNSENLNFSFSTEGLIVYFPSSLILVLFTGNFHSKRVNLITIFILVFATFIAVVLARRNKVLYFSSAFLIATYLVFFSNTILSRTYRFLASSVVFSVLIFIIIFTVLNFESFALFIERTETGIESREDIIDEFFYDFNNTPIDWFTGRGFHGVFVSRTLSTSDSENTRDLIENGFLYLILKGGLIYIGLFVILFIKSLYSGYMKSNNLFSKSMALIILLYLIDLFGYGLPTVGFKYMVVFLAIAVCNSPQINKLNDLEIMERIALK